MTSPLKTHDKIRHAAAALFAERGYSGTSMSRIAERVGIRKASLYNYYSAKEELLLDLLEESLQSWEDSCRLSLVAGGSAEERLSGHLLAVIDFARKNPQKVGIVRLAATQVGGKLGRRIAALIEKHEQHSLPLLSRFFSEAKANGDVDATDEDLLLFWSVFVDGILINQLFATPKAEHYVNRLPELWRLFWRGVSGEEPDRELKG